MTSGLKVNFHKSSLIEWVIFRSSTWVAGGSQSKKGFDLGVNLDQLRIRLNSWGSKYIFFWGVDGGGQKICRVNWTKVCQPRSKVGLRVRDVSEGGEHESLGFYGRSATPICRRRPWGDLVVPTEWRRWGRPYQKNKKKVLDDSAGNIALLVWRIQAKS
ncbi:hypothetical protein MTR_6g069520 [Medicago truncatula]|uniref:Uncharacterized protein n=1 Tax=Medicago truncatula TaxID=3880 RepID=G7KPT1_MEDTR|nr:hypothetical protein MTR_6g069520 [Medicago truncatula]